MMFDDFKPTLSLEDVSMALKKENQFVIFGSKKLGSNVARFLENNGKQVTGFFDIKDLANLPANCNEKIIIASYRGIEIAKYLNKKYGLSYLNDFFFYTDLVNTEIMMFRDLVGKFFYEYLSNNYEKFVEVYNLLSDEYSKDIYKRLISYRLRALNPELIELDRLPGHVSFNLGAGLYSYFDIVVPNNKKMIMNCGASDGSLSAMFALLSPDSRIYAFEPVDESFRKSKIFADVFPNIIPIQAGVWKQTGQVSFNKVNNALSGFTSSFIGDGKEMIDVFALDDFVEKYRVEDVDYIKMDIEGAELDALNGSRGVIGSFHPDLAISVYHKAEHLWRIPLWIKSNFPEYDVYVDHRYFVPTETVCFATINQD